MVMIFALAVNMGAAQASPVNNPLWSGHVTKASATSQVSGSWLVPRLSCATLENDSNASQWIGIGGVNAPLLQVGVVSKCIQGVQVNVGFYEKVVDPTNSAAQYIEPLTHLVGAGDSIDAEIASEGAGAYQVSLNENGAWWQFSTIQMLDSTPQTAEWIVEGGPLNNAAQKLSNFGTVHFEGAFANGQPVTEEGTYTFVATAGSNTRATVSPITQFGGRGPNFDIFWRAY
jgi:hypothetical protein